jgi:AraC-like DNA-binding protein
MQNNAALQHESVVKNDRKLLDALRRSKVYRQYEKAFGEATGLPLALRPVESFELPFHGKKNENPFCAFLADRKGASSFCLQTQERLSKQQGQQPCSVRCPFGLTETRVPVQLGDRLIGFLQVGQVFTQPPKLTAFKKTVRHLFPIGSASEKKLLELWKKTPVIPAEKYAATVQLLKFFAKQLSGLSNQIVIEEANAESPVITRARGYIAAHKIEALSLATVAKVAGASMFHFCKIFHKSTGLNFTDYVARARVEDARKGLLDPNRRISEIAYDVGFQSLTQFNRTFKRIFGQSPSEYRDNLSTHAALAA